METKNTEENRQLISDYFHGSHVPGNVNLNMDILMNVYSRLQDEDYPFQVFIKSGKVESWFFVEPDHRYVEAGLKLPDGYVFPEFQDAVTNTFECRASYRHRNPNKPLMGGSNFVDCETLEEALVFVLANTIRFLNMIKL
jgi:hypothetical protein